MSWVSVFAGFAVAHMVGDYLLQTDWQARHKRGGLGRDGLARRALVSHVTTYTLAFVPALVWLWDDLGPGVFALAALLAITHELQDDGRALAAFARTVKHTDPDEHPMVMVAVDQTFHMVVLLGLALLAT